MAKPRGVFMSDIKTGPAPKHMIFKMLCWQLAYLLFNCVLFLFYRYVSQVMDNMFGFGHVFSRMFSIKFIESMVFLLESGYFLIFLFYLVIIVYPIINIFSFFASMWGCVTGSMQNNKVQFICNSPLILICLFVLICILLTERSTPISSIG